MSELEWLITDKFTINSGGKTPQSRRMQSAAKCFSSKMSPTTLNFSTIPPSPSLSPYPAPAPAGYYKAPLKSIENYYGGAGGAAGKHITREEKVQPGCSGMLGQYDNSMEVFQSLSKEDLSGTSRNHSHCFQDIYQFEDGPNKLNQFSFTEKEGLPFSGPSQNCFSDVDDGLVPECTGMKMARLQRQRRMDDKENSFSLLPALSSEVVRSPTRLDLSCLHSPSRRKVPLCEKLQMRATPSKFTMVRNTLEKTRPPWVTPTKQVPDSAQMLLDYESQDSGFEMTNDKSVERLGDFTRAHLSESSLDIGKFHDELTQSACHYDADVAQRQQLSFYMNEQGGGCKGDNSKERLHEKSPQAHCSKQAEYLTGPPDCEYDTLQDLEDYDSADIALGSSMSKYEIISTDSPDIALAKVTPLAVQRILSDHFQFGSPIGEEETSKDFSQGFQNKIQGAHWAGRTETTRMLNFDTPSPPAGNRTSSSSTSLTSLKDGSVFKLGIQQLSCNMGRKGSGRKGRMEYDSGLGSEGGCLEEEDTLLVLDELEGEAGAGEEMHSDSLHSLIHNAVLQETGSTKKTADPSPPHLSIRKPMFRRCFSLNQSSVASNRENIDVKCDLGLCDSPKSVSCRGAGFKRPDTRLALTNMTNKKRKYSTSEMSTGRPQLHRAMSENQASISMVHQQLTSSLEETDLIGDFSRPYHLPVVGSQHSDLKVISPDTLASLLNGEHADAISSYQIIDCRYPYEYQGGHITGAINLYSEELIYKSLISDVSVHKRNDGEGDTKRHILIFHCEFSLQRGPRLVRYLRSVDREYNNTLYPNLLYPELYLLQGGYCLFYNKFTKYTWPPEGSYVPMLDPKFVQDRRRYQTGSQTKGRRYL